MKSKRLSPIPGSHQLLRHVAAEDKQIQKAAGGSVTDAVAGWLAAEYFAAAHAELATATAPRRWDLLRACVLDWNRLRRCDRAADYVAIARAELAIHQHKSEARDEKEFRRWLKRPDIQEELFPKAERGISPETMAKIEKELNLL
jgi:hypothetical protein